MNRPILVGAFLVTILTGSTTGCSRIDETNLSEVTDAYYSDKASGRQRHKLMSKASAAQWTVEDLAWEPLPHDTHSVLGSNIVNGTAFARVARTASEYCKESTTDTWIQEGGRWRIVSLRNAEKAIEDSMQAGDYDAAVDAAEALLERNPYSVKAYASLLYARLRNGKSSSDAPSRTRDELLKALQAINPRDHRVLFALVTYTDNADVARTFFEQIPPDACIWPSAAFNLALSYSAEQRLKFLRDIHRNSSSLMMLYADTLLELNRLENFGKFFDETTTEQILAELRASDPSYAATWSANLTTGLLRAERYEVAKTFLTFGLGRDPTSRRLGQLAKRLAHPELRRLQLDVEFIDAKPYWDDARVTIRITNRSAVTLHDLSIRVEALDADSNKLGSLRSWNRERVGRLSPNESRSVRATVDGVRAALVRGAEVRVLGSPSALVANEEVELGPEDFVVRNLSAKASLAAD